VSADPVRRVPVQARSRRRYEAILDAAAELFSSAGFDGTTMEAIADEAGSSIGSLYQFFPNKLALFLALAERVLEREEQAFDALASDEAFAQPWPKVLDQIVDGIVMLHRADPSFRAIWTNAQLYGEYADVDAEVTERFVNRIDTLLRRYAPALKKAKRHMVAHMLVEVSSAAIFFSQREEPFDDQRIEELKLMLRRYLEVYLPVVE
jgi:AcrR family transcriptional regulator